MKVGILTFHDTDSYGAVLQAYALQTILKNLGVESSFVSFEKSTSAAERAVPGNPAIRRLIEEGEKRRGLFASFREKHLHVGHPFPREACANIDALFDCFIAGSDQIWNLSVPESDRQFFLPFASPEKRYSYAASFGSGEMPMKVREWCAGQLAGFAALSVREESGRRLIKELTGRDAIVCLDPTMLLEGKDWEAIASQSPDGHYAMLFMLQYNKGLADTAERWAEQHGLPLKIVTASFMPHFGYEAWSSTGPEEWIGLISGADAVFTNSFHGAVFSLIYRRPLRVALLEGALQNRNGRIVELLESLGMNDCIDKSPLTVPVDQWEIYIRERRETSMSYLRKVVGR